MRLVSFALASADWMITVTQKATLYETILARARARGFQPSGTMTGAIGSQLLGWLEQSAGGGIDLKTTLELFAIIWPSLDGQRALARKSIPELIATIRAERAELVTLRYAQKELRSAIETYGFKEDPLTVVGRVGLMARDLPGLVSACVKLGFDPPDHQLGRQIEALTEWLGAGNLMPATPAWRVGSDGKPS